jgi:hypothetical protein
MSRTIGRVALSLLLAAHVAAVVLWNLPDGPLKRHLGGWTGAYLLPTGQWQCWNMFAPDPLRDTIAVEGEARDARGMRHLVRFPRMQGRPPWEAALGFRHSKFAHILIDPQAAAFREIAARHVARTTGIPPDAFPVDVDLTTTVWRTPPFDPGPDTPAPIAPDVLLLDAYRFPTWQEAQP